MNRDNARRSAFVGLILVGGVAISGCNVKFGKEGSTSAAGAADTQSVQLTAEQAQARTDCVAPEKQKDFTPSATPQETDQILLDACKATGRDVFGTLPDASKGKVEVSTSPANAYDALTKTSNLHDATYNVRLLKVAKSVADSGVVSDRLELQQQMLAALPNANQDDVRVGTSGPAPIVLADNKNTQSGPNDFHGNQDQFRSTAEIAAFFASGTPQAIAAKEFVTKAIKDAGLPDKEVERAMSGTGYIPIQLKDASQVLGTTYFKDGKALVLGQWREALPGDIYWFFVSSDGKLVLGATLRGKCWNPNAMAIRIVKAGIPPAPSVTQPPGQETCPPGTVLTSTGECKPPSTPGCKVSCTTSPPPGCKTSCTPTLEQKNPNQIPGNGGEGDGGSKQYGGTGGQKMTAEPTASPPSAGPPPATYNPPPPPVRTTAPPAGSHPTTVQTTPPPQGNQPTGGGNTGVPTPPSGW